MFWKVSWNQTNVSPLQKKKKKSTNDYVGYLGELTLTIPWNNLRGKPVLINIKDAYVLAVPRNESNVRALT